MDVTNLGRLRARILTPAGPPRGVIVLLHGFGAAGDDLVALADYLDLEGAIWVFPEAPLELGGLYGDSRAWWMIDLERSLGTDRSDERPVGLDDARAGMIELLDALTARFPDLPLLLGGFSQGAMLSLDVALHDPRPRALVLLSGTLLAQSVWQPKMAARAGTRVLQSHGRRDGLLPYSAAVKLRDLMTAAGMDVTFVPFEGAHEIPPPVLARLAAFLTSSLLAG